MVVIQSIRDFIGSPYSFVLFKNWKKINILNIIASQREKGKGKNKDFITMDSRDISTSRGCVIAFKLGNDELKDKIQNTLYELKKDGTLKQISEKWFGKDMILVEEK